MAGTGGRLQDSGKGARALAIVIVSPDSEDRRPARLCRPDEAEDEEEDGRKKRKKRKKKR